MCSVSPFLIPTRTMSQFTHAKHVAFYVIQEHPEGGLFIALARRNKGSMHPVGHPGGKVEELDRQGTTLKDVFQTAAWREFAEETGQVVTLGACGTITMPDKMHVEVDPSGKSATVVVVTPQDLLALPRNPDADPEHQAECDDGFTSNPTKHMWVPLTRVLQERLPTVRGEDGIESPIWYRTLNARWVLTRVDYEAIEKSLGECDLDKFGEVDRKEAGDGEPK